MSNWAGPKQIEWFVALGFWTGPIQQPKEGLCLSNPTNTTLNAFERLRAERSVKSLNVSTVSTVRLIAIMSKSKNSSPRS